ncbi:hypothetical protein ACWGJ2_02245 [Streptomyces sp. NPDC054796]
MAEHMATPPSRYGQDTAGAGPASGTRRRVRRLLEANPLWGSNGVAFGPDGRLYVAQYLAGQISAVDPATADIEVVVPMDGPVRSPDDLAFGADGSMYIADLVPGIVWRRSPRGEYTVVSDQVRVPNGITCVGDRLFVNEMRPDGRLLELFPDGGGNGGADGGSDACSGGAAPSELAGGLAMGNAMQTGPDGCLYYPHMLTGQVWRVPTDGGHAELVAEDVHEPVAVRFDQGGVLHVLSRGRSGIVTRIDLHGTGSRTVVTSGVVGLDNAAFDAENRMFVSSYASGGIAEMRPDGRTRDLVPRGLAGPYGVTVGLGGTVYAADHYRVVSPEPPGPDVRDVVTTHVFAPFAHGIAADGELLHVTSQFGEVRTYDTASGESRVRTHGLNRPTGIAKGPDGTLVVAETGAGRVLAVGEDDAVTVLADGLGHPVDVAFDAEGRLHVSDERRGAVLRLDEGEGEGDRAAVTVADGLEGPQGLAVVGDDLFAVETGRRRLVAVSLTTGERRTEAEDLPVGPPPGTGPRPGPALFAHGMPGTPHAFAGLTAAPDGSLLLSANGEGTVLRLAPVAAGATGPEG